MDRDSLSPVIVEAGRVGVVASFNHVHPRFVFSGSPGFSVRRICFRGVFAAKAATALRVPASQVSSCCDCFGLAVAETEERRVHAPVLDSFEHQEPVETSANHARIDVTLWHGHPPNGSSARARTARKASGLRAVRYPLPRHIPKSKNTVAVAPLWACHGQGPSSYAEQRLMGGPAPSE
jgi:hypothetical protein